MMRSSGGLLFALCVFAVSPAGADPRDGDKGRHHEDSDRDDDDRDNSVTSAPPAVHATATSKVDDNGCTIWTFSGTVIESLLSATSTTSVHLVCSNINSLGRGPLVFPLVNNTDALFNGSFSSTQGDGVTVPPGTVGPDGTFTFDVVTGCNGIPVQFDPSYFCIFVAHLPDNGGGDPNGSAPCSGALCPTQP
jgi:hypothetical protein